MVDCACYGGKKGAFVLALIDRELAEPSTNIAEKDLLAFKKEIESCKGKGDEPRAKTGRKLSKFNVFMGECMRSEGKGGRALPMKECIGEWKAQKDG